MRNSAFLVSVVLLLAGGSVRADGFASATALHGTSDVGALLWSFTGSCEQKDDFERRQCEGVRAARRDQLAKQTFLVPADDALKVEPLDEKAMSIDLEIAECISCQGVDIQGKKHVLIGTGQVRKGAGGVRGEKLWSKTITFKSKAEGQTWAAQTGPALGVDLLIRVPDKLRKLTAGPAGYRFDIAGYRLVNRCTGQVVSAKPRSKGLVPDSSRCVQAEPAPAEPTAKGPALPQHPSRDDVMAAMSPAKAAAQKCFETYGVAGKGSLKISIAPDGKVASAHMEGDFAGTPTGTCIEEATAPLTFPRSTKGATINYPFVR